MMNLDEAILHCEEKSDCTECGLEHFQLRNWLKTLKRYIEKDIPKKINESTLSGKCVCPHCNQLMQMYVKNYCDKCGGAIKYD